MSALSIINAYADGKHIFDPFLGWGGRCLGSLCSKALSYTGCDLQPEVVEGCRRVAQDFATLSEVQTEFHHSDCLSFLRSTQDKYDLIFTSPPYMDTENYGIESDAMRQNWLDDFVFSFADECTRHLAPGGHIALHLKDLKGAPTFTAYHAAMKAVGFKQIARHRYGRTWTQAVYVYGR
jgi:16S rRNA G966 N2-methylase RsmD